MDDWWSRDCQHEVNSPTVVEAELTPPDDVVLSKGTIRKLPAYASIIRAEGVETYVRRI
jgi:hypothetical protein